MSRRAVWGLALAFALAGDAAAQPIMLPPGTTLQSPTSLANQLQLAFAMLPSIQKLEGKPLVVGLALEDGGWLAFKRVDRAALERAITAAATARGLAIAGGQIVAISEPETTLPVLAGGSPGGAALAVEVLRDGDDLTLHVWTFDRDSMSGTRFDTQAAGGDVVGWDRNKLTSLGVGVLVIAAALILFRVARGAREREAARPRPLPSRTSGASASAVEAAPGVPAPPPEPRRHEDGIALSEGALAMLSDPGPGLELDAGPSTSSGSSRARASVPPARATDPDRDGVRIQIDLGETAPAGSLPELPAANSGPKIRATPAPPVLASAATALLPPARTSSPDGVLRIRDRYRVTKELGRGAMGVVYRAFDEHLEREVAIKALSEALRGHPDAYKLFASEAKALAQLNHPNVVALFDQISDGGEAYLVMELVEGETLDHILERDGTYEWRDALLLVYHLCAGLAYAHGKNVIHRDIKPANIFVMRDGLPKLGDFGLARVLREVAIRSTEIRGTPLYMAPEQVTGTMIDHRADLYAVGCTLFEVLTGRPPFIEGQVMFLHLAAEPPKPTEFVPGIPPAVEQLVMDLLAKEPDARPPSAQAIRDRIRALVS